MSAKFSVYVGPYVVIPRNELADWSEYEDVFIDGQFESGVDSDNWYLIPQNHTPYRRQMRFDEYSEMSPQNIVVCDVDDEWDSFRRTCDRVLNQALTRRVKWGVVPCIS